MTFDGRSHKNLPNPWRKPHSVWIKMCNHCAPTHQRPSRSFAFECTRLVCRENYLLSQLDSPNCTGNDPSLEYQRVGGLWEAPGRGGKPKWQETDIAYLEECLKQEPRTYNSQQLSEKLASERQVQLSPDRIRRALKKRGWSGSGLARATGINKTPNSDNSSKLTSEMLELAAAAGEIQLKYSRFQVYEAQ